jgi:DNA-binding GntR family transcriptional regulator
MPDERPRRDEPPQRRRAHVGAAERAYEALRDQVLAGRMPLGVRLREDELAQALAMSRTPVRESLLRLYGEGLLDRHRDGGFTPPVPNLVAIKQLYELRLPLEQAGLARPLLTGEPHDPAAVAAVQARWRAMRDDPPAPGEAFVLEDERFHVDVAAASGNLQLARMLQTVFVQIRTVRVRDDHSAERVRLAIEAHVEMIDAIAGGDLSAASDAFERHLNQSLELVPARVATALVSMALDVH